MSKGSSGQSKSRAKKPSRLIERLDGRELRRMSVYLPPALAERLIAYCDAEGREYSKLIAQAIEKHLDGLGA
jgi:hypothetical protein